MSVPSDIEIARAAKMKPIGEWPSGSASRTRRSTTMAATTPRSTWTGSTSSADRPDGKLVLVTAINPTPGRRGQDHDHGRASATG